MNVFSFFFLLVSSRLERRSYIERLIRLYFEISRSDAGKHVHVLFLFAIIIFPIISLRNNKSSRSLIFGWKIKERNRDAKFAAGYKFGERPTDSLCPIPDEFPYHGPVTKRIIYRGLPTAHASPLLPHCNFSKNNSIFARLDRKLVGKRGS